jgi:methionine-R-sulfoxide reductase
MKFTKLTPEEEAVIVGKHTESPFSGEYDNFFEEGVYICRRCGTPLYNSDSKFDAHCGWPSFDQAIPGAVTETPDADGMRTEITCNNCGAHLGHVFIGEHFTKTDARFCVNSLSLKFIPKNDN